MKANQAFDASTDAAAGRSPASQKVKFIFIGHVYTWRDHSLPSHDGRRFIYFTWLKHLVPEGNDGRVGAQLLSSGQKLGRDRSQPGFGGSASMLSSHALLCSKRCAVLLVQPGWARGH